MLKKIPLFIGLTGLIAGEIALFSGYEPAQHWFYPLAWWCYILSLDGIIYALKKNSLILSRTREFLVMLPWSVFIWLIFEFFNLFIKNWHYENINPVQWQRWLGYAVSYATVLPGIFETTEFLETIGVYRKITPSLFRDFISKNIKGLSVFSFCTGLCFLAAPLIRPADCFPLVWLGFIFLLAPPFWPGFKRTGVMPLNNLFNSSPLIHKEQGLNIQKILYLFTAGLICGVLWEFWNYWAVSRWVYSLPYFHSLKIFEMPLLGYLGFMPFAVECYMMYNFISGLRLNGRIFKIIAALIIIATASFLMFNAIDNYTVRTFYS